MADHRGASRARRTPALPRTLTRRALLEAGVALPAVALAAPLMGYAASTALELERFLFDPRFAEAFDVAQAVGGGVPLAPVADDLADFWYRELDLSWREGPMALAGVTLTEALFVLETLAMDRQMRVVYRGEYSRVEDGRIRHKLAGPATMLERFASLPETAAAWEGELARAMTDCPVGRPATLEVELVTSAPGLSIRDMPLTSWIIAPRAAVAVTIRS